MASQLLPCLEVVSPGLLTTVQDAGRFEFTDLGLPVSGAVDPVALQIANLLVGNPADAPALEITIAGPEFTVLQTCAIGLAGADFGARLNNETFLRPGRSYFLRSGSTLTFGAAKTGARAYLALAGGIAAPLALGSASTYLAGGIGGLDGEGGMLKAGDKIAPASFIDPLRAAGKIWPGQAQDLGNVVRVIPGPHFDFFTENAWNLLGQTSWRVSARSDRMGLRLEGEPLPRSEAGKRELLSQGVVRGAIQVPSDGLPIALLADHQTTGGYPVIGVVAAVDWPVLAQLAPGQELRFTMVSLADAQAAYKKQVAEFAAAATTLKGQNFAAGVDWLELAAWAGG